MSFVEKNEGFWGIIEAHWVRMGDIGRGGGCFAERIRRFAERNGERAERNEFFDEGNGGAWGLCMQVPTPPTY